MKFGRLVREARFASRMPWYLGSMHDTILESRNRERMLASPNPLNHAGRKHFSQADEDGITLEIFRRLGVAKGTFVEFGVGDGLENNSLVLISLGWRGIWIGGQKLAFEVDPKWRTFRFLKSWITKNNIVDTLNTGLEGFGQPDFISLDFDGNDLYLVNEILNAGFRPSLFVVEFNGKFPPGAEFSIAYDEQHMWDFEDYFGASLTSFMKIFEASGYFLAATNSFTGANAFFVLETHRHLFSDVPQDVNLLYQEPWYDIYYRHLHSKVGKTVRRMIEMNESRSA